MIIVNSIVAFITAMAIITFVYAVHNDWTMLEQIAAFFMCAGSTYIAIKTNY